MSTRLVLDLLAEAARLRELAAGYGMAGDGALKSHALIAADVTIRAVRAIESFYRAQGEARERDREA